MFDEVLRVSKEKMLEPMAKAIPGIPPAAITVAASLVGIASGTAAAGQQYTAALGLWALNRLLDGLDGTQARVHGKQSDVGGYLDLILDMVVYTAIPLGLALGSNQPGIYLALALLFASFYINSATWMVLSTLLEKRNQGAIARGELTTIHIPRGLIEGLETFIFYALFFLFPHWLTSLFGLMAGLVIFTSVQRAAWAIRHLKS